MSRLDRAVGLARSLAIYHLIPRQRSLRALYGAFVRPGDLAFDIGAHVGNRTRALAALGCRVVAVEPQPAVAATLRRVVRGLTAVAVVEAAVAARSGRACLAVSERTPTVSTLSPEWRAARQTEPDFAGVDWNSVVEVETTTLDTLIGRFGAPAFIKLDIEGGEDAALAGLSRAVPTVSFEFLPQTPSAARRCGERLLTLAPYRFNWTAAESHRLASPAWLTLEQVLAAITASTRHGDIYATLETAHV